MENGEEKGLPLLKEGGLRGKKWRKAGIRPRFSGTEAPLLLLAAGGDDIGSARCQLWQRAGKLLAARAAYLFLYFASECRSPLRKTRTSASGLFIQVSLSLWLLGVKGIKGAISLVETPHCDVSTAYTAVAFPLPNMGGKRLRTYHS